MSVYLNERFQSMKAYVPGEQPKDIKRLIKLNTNENPYPPSPATIEAMTSRVAKNMRLYNSIDALELREVLALELNVRPENIIVSNGSDEILSKIFLAYSDMGARFPDITYGFYRVWARLYGAQFEEIPLKEDYTIDPGDYSGNDAMVVFANPNAPTGVYLPLEGVESIIQSNPDCPVVVDEAYIDFGGVSAVGLLDKYPNLIIVRTFSKSRCMAGARLGYAIANMDIIADLDKIKFSINPYDVNTFTQVMGTAATRDKSYYDECIKKVAETREFTTIELRKLGFTVLDSSSNFVFASPPDKDGANWQRGLRERGILVRHFNQPRLAPFNRVSIGTMDDMRELILASKEMYI